MRAGTEGEIFQFPTPEGLWNATYAAENVSRDWCAEIRDREEHQVRLFMEQIDQRKKPLVFCATQEHALGVRDLINQMKSSKAPDFWVRSTL